jgi:hypothetical protein
LNFCYNITFSKLIRICVLYPKFNQFVCYYDIKPETYLYINFDYSLQWSSFPESLKIKSVVIQFNTFNCCEVLRPHNLLYDSSNINTILWIGMTYSFHCTELSQTIPLFYSSLVKSTKLLYVWDYYFYDKNYLMPKIMKTRFALKNKFYLKKIRTEKRKWNLPLMKEMNYLCTTHRITGNILEQSLN